MNTQIAPIPHCPTHGRMHTPRFGGSGISAFICHGFDGEGCPHTVAYEDLDWQPLGTVEPGELPNMIVHLL